MKGSHILTGCIPLVTVFRESLKRRNPYKLMEGWMSIMLDNKQLDFGGTFEEPRPMTGTVIHKVQITLGDMFDSMAQFEVMEMQRVTRFATNVKLPTFEEMAKYLKTIVYLRVMQVNSPQTLKQYKSAIFSARIPARLTVILDNLGEAYDHEANIRFIPICDINAEDLVSAEEIIAMGNLMETYLMEGYNTTQGIKKDKQGSVFLMSKLVIALPENIERVLSYRKDNPVYAFFAAILKLEIIDLTYEDLRLAYRVQYSDAELYYSRYNQYYRELSKAETKTD